MLRKLRSELDSIHLVQPKSQTHGRMKLGASNQGQDRQICDNACVTQAELDILKLKLEQSMAEATRLQGLMDQMDELFPRYDSFSASLKRSNKNIHKIYVHFTLRKN
jgi:hypothetical protein